MFGDFYSTACLISDSRVEATDKPGSSAASVLCFFHFSRAQNHTLSTLSPPSHLVVHFLRAINYADATMKLLSRPLRSCHNTSLVLSRSRTRHFATSGHPSPSAQKWSHPPSSSPIADDEVAALASQSLHALSLADLVKYATPPPCTEQRVNSPCTDTVDRLSPRKRSSHLQISLSPCCPFAWHTEYRHCETCPSLSSQTPIFPRSTTIICILSPRFCPTTIKPYRPSKTRYASPMYWLTWLIRTRTPSLPWRVDFWSAEGTSIRNKSRTSWTSTCERGSARG